MAERGTIQARLNAGVDAVRAGDMETARKLLRQVLSVDPTNEVAWMWLASAVSSTEERRLCLERALQINPNNGRAREALRRLETAPDADPREALDIRQTELRRAQRQAQEGRRRINPYFVMAGGVLVVMVLAILLALDEPPPAAPASAVDTLTAVAPPDAVATAAALPSPIPGVVVTLDPAVASRLPATFTPTFTPTATETPVPSATPLPLSSYAIIFSGGSAEGEATVLVRARGDGTGELPRDTDAPGFHDLALDPTGSRLAFVRAVAPEEGATPRPQLFVAPIDSPNAAIQITNMSGQQLSSPAWSPDGARLAFASDDDGDLDIWVVPSLGGMPERLTTNPGRDFDPAWSPDGARIAFASDQDTPPYRDHPGSPEIYLMAADGSGTTRLTDANGDSVAPTWSPDGQVIVFVSNRGGDDDLYWMDAEGLGENLLTFDDAGAVDRAPVFTADGAWILFLSNRESPTFQVYAVDPRGDAVTRVTRSDRHIQAVVPLPPGA